MWINSGFSAAYMGCLRWRAVRQLSTRGSNEKTISVDCFGPAVCGTQWTTFSPSAAFLWLRWDRSAAFSYNSLKSSLTVLWWARLSVATCCCEREQQRKLFRQSICLFLKWIHKTDFSSSPGTIDWILWEEFLVKIFGRWGPLPCCWRRGGREFLKI